MEGKAVQLLPVAELGIGHQRLWTALVAEPVLHLLHTLLPPLHLSLYRASVRVAAPAAHPELFRRIPGVLKIKGT